ncbi:MAG: ATP-binding protein [Acidobacteriota bacterium]|nr:ATP-binding protein [Acidobacteriota bacterium]
MTETPTPERAQTDESLRTERENRDERQLERLAATEEEADDAVHKAREQADAVLDAARDRVDQQLETALPPDAAVEAISNIDEARVLEDEALRRERANADEVLDRERKRRLRALSTVLACEREKTDLHLLSERARSDDALANRDDFLGMVSHDLRNLLNGIVMGAGKLASGAPAGDRGNETRKDTTRIQNYAARMDRLIGDLVDVVSIDAGKLALKRVREDCTPLIDEAIDGFREIAAEKNVFLTKIPQASLMAELDPQRVLQVLANLIANSIKFTAAGGSVSVGVERKGNEALFCVRDTGAGIPSEMRDAIFERFWQIGKDDRRGLGLGLYISRCIVEAHGGRIWAESEPGKGSELFFTIPAA